MLYYILQHTHIQFIWDSLPLRLNTLQWFSTVLKIPDPGSYDLVRLPGSLGSLQAFCGPSTLVFFQFPHQTYSCNPLEGFCKLCSHLYCVPLFLSDFYYVTHNYPSDLRMKSHILRTTFPNLFKSNFPVSSCLVFLHIHGRTFAFDYLIK